VQPVNNNFCIAYAPYGPELEPEEEKQGMFLEALSENLKPQNGIANLWLPCF